MMDIYKKGFFKRVEKIPEQKPAASDLVDGKAFAIKHYPLDCPVHVAKQDQITATITEKGGEKFIVTEPLNMAMTIDTVSIFRFNDALGYKHAVGAIFGQRGNK